MSTSLERINFENDKSFFNKETKNEIFTIIKEDNLLQKEIYIELYNQHFNDIINALLYSPYIIYIQVMINNIELTTKFLNNIEMIKNYILKGIIVFRDIYIYEIYGYSYRTWKDHYGNQYYYNFYFNYTEDVYLYVV